MRQVIINLGSRDSFAKQMGLLVVVVLVLVSLAFTGFNVYSYMANEKNLKAYADILDRVRQKALVQNQAVSVNQLDQAAVNQARDDLNNLEAIAQKAMFPVVEILDILETAKPQGIDLNEIRLSQPLQILAIKGESFSEQKLSAFLTALDQVQNFKVKITSEAIDHTQKIGFEIEAALGKNDKNI